MPREYSLKLKRDFETLFKTGIRRGSKNFGLVYKNSTELKFGIIVKKKDIPLATRRVYSKRVVREVIRKEFLPLNSKKLHIAITCRKDLKDLVNEIGFEAVKAELLNLLKQTTFNAPQNQKYQTRTFNNQRTRKFAGENNKTPTSPKYYPGENKA